MYVYNDYRELLTEMWAEMRLHGIPQVWCFDPSYVGRCKKDENQAKLSTRVCKTSLFTWIRWLCGYCKVWSICDMDVVVHVAGMGG
jgi:hypothetical protein